MSLTAIKHHSPPTHLTSWIIIKITDAFLNLFIHLIFHSLVIWHYQLHDHTHTGWTGTALLLNMCGLLFMDTLLDTGDASLFLFLLMRLRKRQKKKKNILDCFLWRLSICSSKLTLCTILSFSKNGTTILYWWYISL